MIRWPWHHWKKPPPLDPKTLAESEEAVKEVERRKQRTQEALRTRHAIIVNNHIAYDIRRALGKRP